MRSEDFEDVVGDLKGKEVGRWLTLFFIFIIYDELFCCVKWGNHFSDWFAVTAGVRQGRVLSPDFYSIYVDDLIEILKSAHKGCYYWKRFVAALFYADDMAIIAPSIKGIVALLNLCGEYCMEWDISLNAKKSRLMSFGRKVEVSHVITLDGSKIDWAEEWTYLGITLKSGKLFNCSVTERIQKFYRCTNAILRIDGHSNDTVMLHLLETHCVPILSYAMEIVHVANRDERRQLRVAYNSIFRKIFDYRWSESVTALQRFLGRPTWEQLVEKRQSSFSGRILRAEIDALTRFLLPLPVE